jgi:hypothetical protein
MKAVEYIEGHQATANFEHLATAVLQANPKKKKAKKSPSQKKSKKSDKD